MATVAPSPRCYSCALQWPALSLQEAASPSAREAKIRPALEGLFFDKSFVLKRAWAHVDELQVVPSQLSAALLRMHLLPKAIANSVPRAPTGKAHLDEVCAFDFENVKHHGATHSSTLLP